MRWSKKKLQEKIGLKLFSTQIWKSFTHACILCSVEEGGTEENYDRDERTLLQGLIKEEARRGAEVAASTTLGGGWESTERIHGESKRNNYKKKQIAKPVSSNGHSCPTVKQLIYVIINRWQPHKPPA